MKDMDVVNDLLLGDAISCRMKDGVVGGLGQM